MRIIVCLFLAVICAGQGVALAEEVKSLQDEQIINVLKQTYLQNPTLEAARAGLRSVDENLPQALAGWKPTAKAEAGVNVARIEGSNFGIGTGSTEKNLGVGVTQPLFRGGRTVAATREAEQQIKAARYGLFAQEQDVLLDAVTVYMDVIRDTALLNLSEKNADVIRQQFDATRERFDVGELTRTDVSQAEARMAAARADIITAKGALKNSHAAYRRVIGDLPETLKTPLIKLDLPPTLEEALEISNDSAPLNLQAQSEYGASEYQVDETFGELLPEVSLSADWTRSYDPQPGVLPESTNRTAGVVATIPLYEAGATRSRIRQAKQVANQEYIEIQEVQRRVRSTIIDAWSNLNTARAEIEARIAQVDAARIAREGVYQEEQLGGRTVLDTLDADQELLDAEVSLVTAQRNEIVAMFSLAGALGYLTPEYLGFPEVEIDYDRHLKQVKRAVFSISGETD